MSPERNPTPSLESLLPQDEIGMMGLVNRLPLLDKGQFVGWNTQMLGRLDRTLALLQEGTLPTPVAYQMYVTLLSHSPEAADVLRALYDQQQAEAAARENQTTPPVEAPIITMPVAEPIPLKRRGRPPGPQKKPKPPVSPISSEAPILPDERPTVEKIIAAPPAEIDTEPPMDQPHEPLPIAAEEETAIEEGGLVFELANGNTIHGVEAVVYQLFHAKGKQYQLIFIEDINAALAQAGYDPTTINLIKLFASLNEQLGAREFERAGTSFYNHSVLFHLDRQYQSEQKTVTSAPSTAEQIFIHNFGEKATDQLAGFIQAHAPSYTAMSARDFAEATLDQSVRNTEDPRHPNVKLLRALNFYLDQDDSKLLAVKHLEKITLSPFDIAVILFLRDRGGGTITRETVRIAKTYARQWLGRQRSQ